MVTLRLLQYYHYDRNYCKLISMPAILLSVFTVLVVILQNSYNYYGKYCGYCGISEFAVIMSFCII